MSTPISEPPNFPPECSKDKFLIQNNADAAVILRCSFVKGDIEVRAFGDVLLVLENVQAIFGTLSITQLPNLVSIEAPVLSTISGTFHLEKLTSLALLHMPSLVAVTVLEWRVLPILGNVNFGHIDGLQSIVIADTSLTGVSGFSSSNLRTFDINNNRFMESIRSDVQHISENLHIAANADNVAVELKSLVSTRNMTIHNVASLEVGKLETVKGTINIIANYFAQMKMPNLVSVEGTFSVAQNDNLDQVDLSHLQEIGGGLLVVDNLHLNSLDFLPRLSIIGGALQLVGNIKLAAWKSLKLVKGSARVVTSNTGFSCDQWRKRVAGTVRGGKIECIVTENTGSHGYLVPEYRASGAAAVHPGTPCVIGGLAVMMMLLAGGQVV